MNRRLALTLAVTAAAAAFTGATAGAASPVLPTCTNTTVTCKVGATSDGSTWKIERPPNWNGTLLLYSHGYVPPTTPSGQPATNPPADDFQDRQAADYLLAHGFALAGSSYPNVGWAVKEAVPDQVGLLREFRHDFGKPRRTIAWGHSMGGMITADLVQTFPRLFDGALPMCGILGGGIGLWNQNLDLETSFKTLMEEDPNPAVSGPAQTLQLVHVQNPAANTGAAEAALAAAQQTAQGRARLALVSALFNLPTWYDPAAPEPGATDYAAQETNQFQALQTQVAFVFGFRSELEGRAGGNPTWNTGVDYRRLLKRSSDKAEAKALYKDAGLALGKDLRAINAAPRITADRQAVRYLTKNVVFDGRIDVPVLTMHTTSDWLVPVPHEQSYGQAVRNAGNAALLRQLFVHRAGHCEFSDAEMLTALNALIGRLDGKHWPSLDPAGLNAQANAFGASFNTVSDGPATIPSAPAFTQFKPPVFLRPFVLPPGDRPHGLRGRHRHGHHPGHHARRHHR
jgi:pimeloyl-ACP methyl ester carboxylesterase